MKDILLKTKIGIKGKTHNKKWRDLQIKDINKRAHGKLIKTFQHSLRSLSIRRA
jgi:hypothetical protein